MLSMKTLRVAIVTMGSALLLGPGFAAATTQVLDARGGPNAVTYAAETLAAAKDSTGRTNAFTPADISNVMSQGRTTHYALISPDAAAHVLVVKPARRIESTETLFVRLDLSGGMVLNGQTVAVHQAARTFTGTDDADDTDYTSGAISNATTAGDVQSAGGMAGDSYVVFRISGQAIALNASLWIRLDHALAVPRGTGTYDASISAFTNADDAVADVGAVSTISGSGTIVRVASGLDASVTAGDPLEAAVATGFRWFNGGSPFRAQARMGLFQAIANPMGVLSANDGMPAMDADIISDNDGSVMVTVEGDLAIGAFSVVNYMEAVADDTTTADVDESMPAGYAACPTGPAAVDDDPMNDDMGTLTNPDDAEAAVTSVGTQSLDAGMYGLCVNVDTAGPMSNMNAIPEGEYTATVSILTPGAHISEAVEAASGMIGTITRDGASVEIPYLTTSEKHNQRIIIVNRGSAPVAITSIDFTTEAGTDAELMAPVQALLDAGQLAVPGNSSYVARMDETVVITGDSRRTAATINFFGVSGNLSVATTQVNVSDGSTDTVVYNVD